MVELDVPGDGACLASCNPAVHTTGAHYINGDTTAFMQFITVGPVQGLPDPEAHHPAWRRRGALSLGPLSRAGAEQRSRELTEHDAEQRVLRHLRLSPAGHRPAAQGDAGRQHPVRLGDGRRRAGHRSEDRLRLDDTKRYVDVPSSLVAADKPKVFEGNARKVYPRINAKLAGLEPPASSNCWFIPRSVLKHASRRMASGPACGHLFETPLRGLLRMRFGAGCGMTISDNRSTCCNAGLGQTISHSTFRPTHPRFTSKRGCGVVRSVQA